MLLGTRYSAGKQIKIIKIINNNEICLKCGTLRLHAISANHKRRFIIFSYSIIQMENGVTYEHHENRENQIAQKAYVMVLNGERWSIFHR